ncbi:MAG: hypothetical protein ACPGXK_09280 [Phycisphaerae bacterium]
MSFSHGLFRHPTKRVRFLATGGRSLLLLAAIVMGAVSGSVEAGTSRDYPQESADIADCLNGPDLMPEPTGVVDAATCLDMFDYDDDDDVDMADYETYLKSASPDESPSLEVGDTTYTDHSFDLYDDDGTIEIHSGFQGGTHVFLAIRGYNFPPGEPIDFFRSGQAIEPIPVSDTISLEQIFLSPNQPFGNIAFPSIGVGVSQTQRFQLITLLPPGTGDFETIDLEVTARTRNVEPPVEATVVVRVTMIPAE